jgi:hypothetical protein
MKVLFVNHKIKKCGVYQYGVRLFDILKKSTNVNYIFKEIDTYNEYIEALNHTSYDAILYNYHPVIMKWLNVNSIQTKIKNIGLQHDLVENDIFDITLRLDTTLPERNDRYNIPRPIFENIDTLLDNYVPSIDSVNSFINYKEDGVPIFGSFGFGFKRKGFHKIVKLINDNYDNAIIKFVMPHADTQSSDVGIVEECKSYITKPTIKLIISHDFFSEMDILFFLKSNTMNLFLYDTHLSAGVSSVTDYALSVKTPLAISNASWFRHIYSDEICVDKTHINDIMSLSTGHCEQILKLFSHDNLIQKVDNIMIHSYL